MLANDIDWTIIFVLVRDVRKWHPTKNATTRYIYPKLFAAAVASRCLDIKKKRKVLYLKCFVGLGGHQWGIEIIPQLRVSALIL